MLMLLEHDPCFESQGEHTECFHTERKDLLWGPEFTLEGGNFHRWENTYRLWGDQHQAEAGVAHEISPELPDSQDWKGTRGSPAPNIQLDV